MLASGQISKGEWYRGKINKNSTSELGYYIRRKMDLFSLLHPDSNGLS